ncbi:MAG TPA: phosphomannose isomerase type II C-terminal cupin domain [Acidimicrobiales bacterium]
MADQRDALKEPPEEYREERPWGDFRRLVHNEPCTVKIITVQPGQRLSLQSHNHRSELWVFLDEGGIAEVDGEVRHPTPGEKVFIPCGAKHRLATAADAPGSVRVVEMGFGDFDEDDIVRYEDQYGRA